MGKDCAVPFDPDRGVGLPQKRGLWRTYNKFADNYKKVNPATEWAGHALVQYASPPINARVLDVGSGRGAVARAARDRGCSVTAIDAAPRMVEHLATECPDITVQQMPAEQLAFPDASFDMVTGGYLLDVLDDAPAAVAEFRRVLVAGGILALSEPAPVRERWRWLHDLASQYWSRSPHTEAVSERRDALQRVTDLMTAAGFVRQEERSWSRIQPVTGVEELWHALKLDDATASLTQEERREFQRHFSSAAAARALDELHLDHEAVLYRGHAP